MEKQLTYIVKWGQQKDIAWSGTYWSLFKALQSYYDIEEIDLTKKPSLFQRFLNRYTKPDIGLRAVRNDGKIVRTLLNDGRKRTILQFAETVFDSPNYNTYIYQDLNVSYVQYMLEQTPDIFAVSAYQKNSHSAIRERTEYQDKYYETCSGIFTMGKWLAKDLAERCHIDSAKIYPVGGGINLDKSLIDRSSKKGNKILFVGRDFIRKGGYMVVEAFKELKKRREDAELYVAGPKQNPIYEAIEGYHFMGDCDYKKTAELFNLCDVYCMPSYFEAYGLVFIEALTFGLPVIARNAFEMPYFVEDNNTGLLLSNDSVGELSEMMDRLLSDNEIKKNVADRQDYYLGEYSWNTVAGRIFSIIS